MIHRRKFALAIGALALGCCAAGQASARTFGGYDCGDDCIGHAAGYRWAAQREIEYVDDCPLNMSDAFYQGCLAYVDDPDRGADFDDDGEAIPTTRLSSGQRNNYSYSVNAGRQLITMSA